VVLNISDTEPVTSKMSSKVGRPTETPAPTVMLPATPMCPGSVRTNRTPVTEP